MTNHQSCQSTIRIFGELLYCQLPKGHGSNHVHSITWKDDKQ